MTSRTWCAVSGMIAISLSLNAHSMDRERVANVMQQIQQSAAAQCRNDEFRGCMDISRQDCLAKAEQTVSACRQEVDAADSDHEQVLQSCLQERAPKEYGASATRMEACGEQARSSGGSDEERLAELERQAEERAERDQAEIRERTQAHMDAQGVSREDITLPVYPDADMTSHLPPGSSFSMGGQDMALADDIAQASLQTAGPVDEVVGFYRERLEGFTEDDSQDDGHYLFVDGEVPSGSPIDPDWVRQMKNKPHVSITDLDGSVLIQKHYHP